MQDAKKNNNKNKITIIVGKCKSDLSETLKLWGLRIFTAKATTGTLGPLILSLVTDRVYKTTFVIC